MEALLHPAEVDEVLIWPRGRTVRLARAGQFAAVRLPTGEYRVRSEDLDALIRAGHNFPEMLAEHRVETTTETGGGGSDAAA